MAKWPSDKELAEIYRKGSEQHDFSYDPNAWADMERMLDKDRKRRFLWIFFLGFFILSLGSFSFYSLLNDTSPTIENNATTENNRHNNVIPNITSTAPPTPEHSNGNKSNLNKEQIESSASGLSNQKVQLSQTNIANNLSLNKSNKEKDTNINNKNSSDKSSKFSLNKSLNSKPNLDSKLQNTYRETPPTIVYGSENQEAHSDGNLLTQNNETKSEIVRNNTDDNNQSTPKKLYGIRLLPLVSPDLFLIELDFQELDNTHWVVQNSGDDNLIRKTRLWLNLGLESSWTTNGEFSSLDFAIGLQLSHLVSPKFGLNLGVNYINDFYIAEEGDYNAGYGSNFWPNGEEPIYTAADCKMIEISFGGKYYMKDAFESGLALGFSLTSNVMLSESYEYHYEEEINNFGSKWATSNVTFLSSLHLQPSYQFKYGKNGMFDFGPYFKIPLSGIGHGGVMLSSFGMRASVAITK